MLHPHATKIADFVVKDRRTNKSRKNITPSRSMQQSFLPRSPPYLLAKGARRPVQLMAFGRQQPSAQRARTGAQLLCCFGLSDIAMHHLLPFLRAHVCGQVHFQLHAASRLSGVGDGPEKDIA